MQSEFVSPNGNILPLLQADSALPEGTPTDILSHRQLQILTMIAEDLTSKQIAWRLGVSFKTVEFHRINIKQKLGVNGIAGMVRYAIRTGLLEP